MTLLSAGFLPICSYSNRLRSRKGAGEAVDFLTGNFASAALVIADELQHINLRLRGVETNEALKNSNIAASNSAIMYESIVRSRGLSNILVTRLSVVRQKSDFRRIEHDVLRALYSVARFEEEANRFVSWSSRRFGWVDSSNNRKLEREYLNLELVTSIYMAEIAGYPTEVWEEIGSTSPDPLTVAYGSARAELLEALGKTTLARKLVSLTSLNQALLTEV